MQTRTRDIPVESEVTATTAAGQSIRSSLSLQVVTALPWIALTAEYFRAFFRHLFRHGRAFAFHFLMILFLFNIPSISYITRAVSFLKTAEDAEILKELGPKGRFTFFWIKMVVFCLTLSTILIEMLQISRFSDGTLAALLLILAIVLAFNSLTTGIVYCWYMYCTTHETHVRAWKQIAVDIDDNAMSIMISLPLSNFLWAVLLLCLSFAVSYACPPVVCVHIGDALSRMALIGPPVLAALIFVCYALHGFTAVYILRRYHALLGSQPQSEDLATLSV